MTLSFTIHKDLDLVFEQLTDMQKFAAVHPVITKIDQNTNGHYLVHETLRFAFIPFSFSYPASVEQRFADKTVWMRATVFKLTKIEMRFRLTAEQNFTRIEEEIQFKSPFPIQFLLKKVFREQHEKLFKNIEAL